MRIVLAILMGALGWVFEATALGGMSPTSPCAFPPKGVGPGGYYKVVNDYGFVECRYGKLHGRAESRVKGVVVMEATYDLDRLDGVSRRRDASGALTSEEIYSKGEHVSSINWQKTGQPVDYSLGNAAKYYISWDGAGRILQEHGERPVSFPKSIAHMRPLDSDPIVPDAIMQRANAFVVEVVGPKYFSKNYRPDPRKSSRTLGKVPEYIVGYRYAALSRVGAENDSVTVRLGPERLQGGFVAQTKVDGEVEEPRVTRAKAIDIARGSKAAAAAKVLSNPPEQVSISEDTARWKWFVSLRMPHVPGCLYGLEIAIDAITGVVGKSRQWGGCR